MQKSLLTDEDITWIDYPNDRKAKLTDEYIVIVPSSWDQDDPSFVPIFCDVCEFGLTSLDEESQKKFQCCSTCADTWAYANKKEWEKGWRPSTEEVDRAIKNRIFVDDNIRFK